MARKKLTCMYCGCKELVLDNTDVVVTEDSIKSYNVYRCCDCDSLLVVNKK